MEFTQTRLILLCTYHCTKGGSKMDIEFIRNRITQLRLQKGISEHRLSLELGHARSYIHGIVSGKTLPSMTEFFYICEYFNISPEQFFSSDETISLLNFEIERESRKLSIEDQKLLLSFIKRMQQ